MGRRAMTLLFVTQKMDADDAVLGFVTDWVRALAAMFDDVTVIANETGRVPSDLGARVVSLGREDGRSRAARGAAYVLEIERRTRGGHAQGLIAHMCPAYLNLAAPILLMRHVPALLWFAHPSVTPALRLADRLATAILTSLPGSYPLAGPKVRVIGQAVDLEAFPPAPPTGDGPLRLIAIGRTSPAKGFSTIVRAAAEARAEGVDTELRLIGPSTTPDERRHRMELTQLIDETLGSAGALEAGVPHQGVAPAIAEADVLVNAMVAGSGDKVVFEAAAMQRPVLVSNPAFAELLANLPLELRFPAGDHRALAARIAELAEADPAHREAVGKELRVRVARGHSLSHWADAVAAVVGEYR